MLTSGTLAHTSLPPPFPRYVAAAGIDGSWSLVLRPPTVTGDTTAVNSCLAGIVCRPAFLDKYSRVTFSERRLVTVREQWGGSGLITIEVRLAVHCRAISSRALALCGWMCICGCVRARVCACVGECTCTCVNVHGEVCACTCVCVYVCTTPCSPTSPHPVPSNSEYLTPPPSFQFLPPNCVDLLHAHLNPQVFDRGRVTSDTIVLTKHRLRAVLGCLTDLQLAVSLGYAGSKWSAPDSRVTALDVLQAPEWPRVRAAVLANVVVGERCVCHESFLRAVCMLMCVCLCVYGHVCLCSVAVHFVRVCTHCGCVCPESAAATTLPLMLTVFVLVLILLLLCMLL